MVTINSGHADLRLTEERFYSLILDGGEQIWVIITLDLDDQLAVTVTKPSDVKNEAVVSVYKKRVFLINRNWLTVHVVSDLSEEKDVLYFVPLTKLGEHFNSDVNFSISKLSNFNGRHSELVLCTNDRPIREPTEPVDLSVKSDH